MFSFQRNKGSGWVAEYCTICRDVQPHRVVHLKDERGQSLPPAVECSSCGLRSSTQPGRYVSVLPSLPQNTQELVTATFPRLPLAVAGRVLWEREAIGHQLQPPERQQALQEPFLTLSYLARRRDGIFAFITFAVLFSIVSFIPTTFLTFAAFPLRLQDRAFSVLAPLGVAISIFLSAWGVLRSRRKSGKPVVLPMLSKSLRPLRPTLEELQSVTNWAAAMRQPVGTLFSANELFDAISRQPDRSLVHADEINLIDEARRMHTELNPALDESGRSGPQDSHESDAGAGH